MENMIKILSFQSLWCWDFQWICLILLKFYFYFYLFSKTAHVFFCPWVYSLSVPAWQTSDKTHTIPKLATTNHLTFFWIFFCKQSVFIFGTKGFSKHGSTCGIDLLNAKALISQFSQPTCSWRRRICLSIDNEVVKYFCYRLMLTFSNVFARGVENIAGADNLYCWPASSLPN